MYLSYLALLVKVKICCVRYISSYETWVLHSAFCMHLSWKLPVNARDVIENAISFQRERREGAKNLVRSVSSICGSVEGRGHFLPPSIDRFSIKAYLPRGAPHKKCPCNPHCVVLWRVANYRNIVRHSEWSGCSHLFLHVSTQCTEYLVVGHPIVGFNALFCD